MTLLLLALLQDSKKELRDCSNQMSRMIKGMYNYSVTHEPEGSFPEDTGPAFWRTLVESEGFEEKQIKCPVTGRHYRGPKVNANKSPAESALSLCDHGTKVVIGFKAGSVQVFDRGSGQLEIALIETLGYFGWESVGARWTYAADGATPLVVEVKELLAFGGAAGAILEWSGGDLKEPVRETLCADASGIRRFDGSLEDERRLAALLADLKSDDYDVREKATAGLAELYPKARDRIEKALAGDDLEAQGRLRTIRKSSVAHAPLVTAYPPKGESVEVKTPLGQFRGWKISDEVVWSDDLHLPLTITRGGTTWTLKEFSIPSPSREPVRQFVCKRCGLTSPKAGKCPMCEIDLVAAGND